MKTIPELSAAYGIHRDTLLKAAKRDEFPARLASKKAYLIDEESPEFKEWLQSRERKIIMSMKWIEYSNHYQHPVRYNSQVKAAKVAQKLSEQLKIFTETVRIDDEEEGSYFVIITKNDVPH